MRACPMAGCVCWAVLQTACVANMVCLRWLEVRLELCGRGIVGRAPASTHFRHKCVCHTGHIAGARVHVVQIIRRRVNSRRKLMQAGHSSS